MTPESDRLLGAWGPSASGGPGRRWPMRLLAVLSTLSIGVVAALGTSAVVAVSDAEKARERLDVQALQEREAEGPLNVLVVGSDGRDDLTPEERAELSLGQDFEGQRSDTLLLVSTPADRSTVNVVSIPRDFLVGEPLAAGGDGIDKITERFSGGADELVRTVREDVGLPVNNYLQVSISGFLEVVEAIGSVRLCLDEPLTDSKSGADFEAGCQVMDPEEALSYVRSRQDAGSTFGDFSRIQRQQQFLRALLAQAVDTRLLLEPDRLVDVVNQVSSSLITDEDLTVQTGLGLARDLQSIAEGDLPMVTAPGYNAERLDENFTDEGERRGGVRRDFVVPYEPGLEALIADVEAGRPLPSRGPEEERAEMDVGVWSSGLAGAPQVIVDTLNAGGFSSFGLGVGPMDPPETVVVELPGKEEEAGWAAAHLGARVVPLPFGVDPPDVDVVVAAGPDAEPDTGAGPSLTGG